MAERRMFAKSIVLSDAFLDMPMSARCLYFTLGMLADDDGFIGNPKSVMRQCGASQDDMLALLQKRYVLDCGNGVLVIKHWRMNNYLQNDRYKETTYLEEKALFTTDKKGAYTEKEKPMYTTCIQTVYTGKDSIGKDSIGNNTMGKSKRFTPPTLEEVQAYCVERNNNVDAKKFFDYYTANDWKDSKGNKVKSWKQKVITWESKQPKSKAPDFSNKTYEQAASDYEQIKKELGI